MLSVICVKCQNPLYVANAIAETFDFVTSKVQLLQICNEIFFAVLELSSTADNKSAKESLHPPTLSCELNYFVEKYVLGRLI